MVSALSPPTVKETALGLLALSCSVRPTEPLRPPNVNAWPITELSNTSDPALPMKMLSAKALAFATSNVPPLIVVPPV